MNDIKAKCQKCGTLFAPCAQCGRFKCYRCNTGCLCDPNFGGPAK